MWLQQHCGVSNLPLPLLTLLAGNASAAPGANGVSGTAAKGGKGMSMSERGKFLTWASPLGPTDVSAI